MIGKIVSHYEIVEKLGEGGMGVVYRARDTKLDRDVAIKFLPPHLSSDKRAEARFVQEAKAASALNHSNIAVIHEIDETSDGRMFIVMAYYDGRTLKDRIEDGPLTVDEALEIAGQLAAGLAAAHGKGILHRDVKPSNILLTSSGEAKIADFGLAKLAGQTRLTETGTTVGTVAYMSPEQARGEDVDERSDIFSLGVVLYEMLTGETPFKGDHEAAVLYGIMHNEPAPLESVRPDLPAGIQHMIDRSLAKDRDLRYSSAGDLLEDLRAVISGAVPRERSRLRSSRLAIGAIASLSAVALVVGSYLLYARHKASMVSRDRNSRFAITIAPFWGVNEKAREEADVTRALIESELSDVFRGDSDIAVIRAPQSNAPRVPDEARDFGTRVGANMVVWGEVFALHDEVEIRPHVTVVDPIGREGQRNVSFFSVPIEEMAGSLQAYLSQPGQLTQRREKARDVRDAVLLVAGLYCSQRYEQEKAESLIRRISQPSSDALATLARVVLEQGRQAEAESLAVASLESDPENPMAYNIYGFILGVRRDNEASLEKFETAVRLDSTYVPSYGNAGIACMRMGRYDEALDWFDKQLDRDPSLAVTYMGKGLVFRMKGEPERAEAAYQKAIDLDPFFVQAYLESGFLSFAGQRYEEAIERFEKALGIDPERFNVNHWIGFCYQLMERFDDAAVRYEAEISRHPENFWSYINLGHILYMHGDFGRAADVYRRAYHANRSLSAQAAWFLPYTQVMRLISALRSGRAEEARRDFIAFSDAYERNGWPGPLVDFFAGRVGEDSLLAATAAGEPAPDDVKGRECEACYFLGMARLLGLPGEARPSSADTSVAVMYFRECLNTGLTNSNEYIYATRDLQLLIDAGIESSTGGDTGR